MQIKVVIQVSPLESWQRYRLDGIVSRLCTDLERIQYESDADPVVDIQEISPEVAHAE